MPPRRKQPTPEGPADIARRDGLAYTLWTPSRPPSAGVVVLHGAGSCKENHHDVARAVRAAGWAAIVADLRGHGESDGAFGSGVLDDVATLADLLREPPSPRPVRPGGLKASNGDDHHHFPPSGPTGDGDDGEGSLPIVLRGSSMGGWLAICAAERARADAVIAICPATSAGLADGLRAGRFAMRADVDACEALLTEHDPLLVVGQQATPLLLLHAEGDETVPVDHSRELAARSVAPDTRLIVVPGGHHRSVQHDAELQGVALRWARRALTQPA